MEKREEENQKEKGRRRYGGDLEGRLGIYCPKRRRLHGLEESKRKPLCVLGVRVPDSTGSPCLHALLSLNFEMPKPPATFSFLLLSVIRLTFGSDFLSGPYGWLYRVICTDIQVVEEICPPISKLHNFVILTLYLSFSLAQRFFFCFFFFLFLSFSISLFTFASTNQLSLN